MVGRKVVCFLKSPLYPFTLAGTPPAAFPRDIVQVRGEVLKEKGAGLLLRLEAAGAEGEPIDRLHPLPEPLTGEIFLPFAKVDYLLVN